MTKYMEEGLLGFMGVVASCNGGADDHVLAEGWLSNEVSMIV